MIVPSSSRRSTQVVRLAPVRRRLQLAAAAHRARRSTSGITSPWLHSTAPVGQRGEQLEHAQGTTMPSASRSSVCTGSRSRWAERLQGLHAAQVRAADQRGGVALGQPPGDGGGLSLAGLGQRAQLVVARPTRTASRPWRGGRGTASATTPHRSPAGGGADQLRARASGRRRSPRVSPDGDDDVERQVRIELLGHARAPRSRCRSLLELRDAGPALVNRPIERHQPVEHPPGVDDRRRPSPAASPSAGVASVSLAFHSSRNISHGTTYSTHGRDEPSADRPAGRELQSLADRWPARSWPSGTSRSSSARRWRHHQATEPAEDAEMPPPLTPRESRNESQ